MLNKEQINELRQNIILVLQTIFDPEIPVNIWDLGLIYGIDIQENGEITVIMTLTSPNCPVIDILPRQIENQLENLEQIQDIVVKLIWEPAWNKEMMSEEARLELGFM